MYNDYDYIFHKMMDDDGGNRENILTGDACPIGPDMCPDTLKRTLFGLFGDKEGAPQEML
jgi:hypothetical protein